MVEHWQSGQTKRQWTEERHCQIGQQGNGDAAGAQNRKAGRTDETASKEAHDMEENGCRRLVSNVCLHASMTSTRLLLHLRLMQAKRLANTEEEYIPLNNKLRQAAEI